MIGKVFAASVRWFVDFDRSVGHRPGHRSEQNERLGVVTMMRKAMAMAALLFLGSIALFGQNVPPAIFYTDLQSGPNTGGDTQNRYSGVYVTLYGNSFGSSQGSATVTLNAASCLRVVSWGTSWLWYQKIVLQLGPSCTSGNFVVTTSAGSSNPQPFTVRSGNIYCISTTGNDSATGKFPRSCWSTLASAVSKMVAGDTVYLEDGVVNTATSAYSAVVNITGNPGGTAASPIAMVAYPGAKATIGMFGGAEYAIRVPQIGPSPAYYVIAGLTLRGGETIDAFHANHWRVVANDMSCTADLGCFHGNSSNYLYLYGDWVHDINGAAKLSHAIYMTTNSNHVWIAWSLVDPDPNHTGAAGCRGIQFYSTDGADQYDLHVHDNIIRNTICDGLNFQTVNPDLGPVEAYNNLIYHSGTGPDPQGQGAGYACVDTNSGGGSAVPTTPVDIFNNTLYDCGSRGSFNHGAFVTGIPARLRNNISYMTGSTEPYIGAGACSLFTGSNNDWYGNGSAPCSSNLTGNLNVNPGFTSTSIPDLHLASTSPLINAGITTGALSDVAGVPRPQGSAYDIGAYGYLSGASPSATCDLNGDGLVNDTDVTIAINQALGIGGYNNSDLSGDGAWNVVDVQRVINSRNGQGCKIGP